MVNNSHSFSPLSFTSTSFTTKPALSYAFDASSFDSSSFAVYPVPIISTGSSGGDKRRRNRWRAWIASWARDLKNFFKIKQRPPEPEDVPIPIPTPQPPKIFHILPSPPTMETKLETLNDRWASVPPPISRDGTNESKNTPEKEMEMGGSSSYAPVTVYPLILNPLTAPLIQTKVTLPKSIIRQPYIPTPTKADGSHIESYGVGMKRPKNRSKAAATINTLMLLLEIERQV